MLRSFRVCSSVCYLALLSSLVSNWCVCFVRNQSQQCIIQTQLNHWFQMKCDGEKQARNKVHWIFFWHQNCTINTWQAIFEIDNGIQSISSLWLTTNGLHSINRFACQRIVNRVEESEKNEPCWFRLVFSLVRFENGVRQLSVPFLMHLSPPWLTHEQSDWWRARERNVHRKQWKPMPKAESQKHDMWPYDFTCWICNCVNYMKT